ncbi:hypothetical protein [Robinsoniella peoriensis]|uniref:hypothetical protein n=1 Tax=Robinsoniella peoriensis TaxID=180332 RepID=UPI00159F1077|nr:hypothetical protein [Robinsoniella peoriensis]
MSRKKENKRKNKKESFCLNVILARSQTKRFFFAFFTGVVRDILPEVKKTIHLSKKA